MARLNLRDFKIPIGRIAPQTEFCTQDGTFLSCREYPAATSQKVVILYHGVGGDSRYMCVLASEIAKADIATVVTPDLRGHGLSLNVSDEIAEGQLLQDLDDCLTHLRLQRKPSEIVLSGHSLGGGLVLKASVSYLASQFSRFVVMAPRLPAGLEAVTSNRGGWTTLTPDGGLVVNMAPEFISGQERLRYSAAFIRAATPSENVLETCPREKVFAVTGADDEVVDPLRQQELFDSQGISFRLLADLNHITVVSRVGSYLDLF